MITIDVLKKDEEIQTLLKLSEEQLEVLGYTEHSFRHVGIVCARIETILSAVNAPRKDLELGLIAGYLHDIGNSINRADHAQSGAILAYNLLLRKGMDVEDAADVMMAIGNHDEQSGRAVSVISAALILADKSDVHRSRVRRNKLNDEMGLKDKEDIHDRVNYAVEGSIIKINADTREIAFEFNVDTNICSTMDYFEIFLTRMKMCKEAAQYLNLRFKLRINNNDLV